jgi:peptidoglycan biosynthesis protein MviN/MurJ (putative lipid II flippase)
MRIRTLIAALVSVATSLGLAAPALASGAGEGWAGETNDKVVTFFCLGVLLFFILVVVLGTLIQSTLERRKDARKAAKMRQRVGW